MRGVDSSNRMVRVAGGFVVVSLALMAATSGFVAPRTRSLDVEELRIVRDGTTYIRLHADKDGGVFEILAADGKPRLVIRSLAGGCYIGMDGEKGDAARRIVVADEVCSDTTVLGDAVVSDLVRLLKGQVEVQLGAKAAGSVYKLVLDTNGAFALLDGEREVELKVTGDHIKALVEPSEGFDGEIDLGLLKGRFRVADQRGFSASASGTSEKATWSWK